LINGPSYQVEHQCPQCSAPIVSSEDDQLVSCPYCKVRLLISFEGYPRYYLSPRGNEGADFFVPYWRSKGIAFSVRIGGVEESFVERTWNASPFACFPSSLGARPQTQRLRLAEPDGEHRLLRALASPDEPPPIQPLPSIIGHGLLEPEEPPLFRALLRDTSSLIYLPVFQRGETVYDGIDLKALGSLPDELSGTSYPTGEADQCRHQFVPALCPNCGNDLVCEKESRIVFCQGCTVAFSVSDGQLTETPFVVGKGGSKTATFLPFWAIRVETEGLPLPSTTGVILPGGRIEPLDKDNFHFWVPAFRINPRLFLRLAHRATTVQLDTEPATNLPGVSSIAPVTIPFLEAVKVTKILLALLSPRDGELRLRLSDLSVKVNECVAVLVPFEQTGYELTNRQIQVAVHVNALKYGRNL
jgi:DNA-directed RNA polymerase subunit RPC12/RpoP